MTSPAARLRLVHPRGGHRVRLHAVRDSAPEARLRAVVHGHEAPTIAPSIASDGRAGYAADGPPVPASPDPEPAGDLRAAVANAAAALERAHRIATTRGVSSGGELAGLAELLGALDRGHAAAVALVDRIETDSLAERRMGLPLEAVLAMQTRTTYGDRRFLAGARDVLRHLPRVWKAFDEGVLGWGQVRAIVAEARPLTVAMRDELDRRFADLDEVARLQPDELVDRTRDAATGLRDDLERRREVHRQQRRFHHMQPMLDGGIEGGYQYPGEEGALIREALEAMAAAPTGERDVTADGLDPTDPYTGSDTGLARDDVAPDRFDRPRARQLADAFVRMAEAVLAGRRGDGSIVRARPTNLVVTDIRDLVGQHETARRARLLWRLPGAPPALTAEAIERILCDADLQFLLVDGHQVLGISAPVSAIPARLRRAAQARDQGCRFPGCRAPIGWTDLHHVIPRNRGGPTILDNLVSVCRRHHVALTEGRWRLTMTPDGIVTVRRGRHRATSDPPLRRHPIDG